MSEREKLQEDLRTVKKAINYRIQSANNKKLPGMIRDIARNHGEYTDWGGGEYHYHENGLSISYSNYSGNYVRVNLGYNTEDVFRASLYANDVGDISLYIPGAWEERIEALHNEIPKTKEQKQVEALQIEIKELREKWQLEEI